MYQYRKTVCYSIRVDVKSSWKGIPKKIKCHVLVWWIKNQYIFRLLVLWIASMGFFSDTHMPTHINMKHIIVLWSFLRWHRLLKSFLLWGAFISTRGTNRGANGWRDRLKIVASVNSVYVRDFAMLTLWGLDKMAAILQATYSKWFS